MYSSSFNSYSEIKVMIVGLRIYLKIKNRDMLDYEKLYHDKVSYCVELEYQIDELNEYVLDVFTQVCLQRDGKYDHMCISTYEDMQDLLIRTEAIKKEDCYRS